MLSLKKQSKTPAANGFTKAAKNPFADLEATPSTHFELYFLAATAQIARRLTNIYGTRSAVFGELPFLEIYDERLAGREPDELTDEKSPAWWEKHLILWENAADAHLPLKDLREKLGFEFSEIILLLMIGLVEEDARFGAVFEAINEFSVEKRLTFGTIDFWFKAENQACSAQRTLSRLQGSGLVKFGNTDSPRSEWTLAVEPLLWDALRGETHFLQADWLKIRTAKELLSLDELILSESLKRRLVVLPGLFRQGEVKTLILRGAHHNSRKTIFGALAKALDLSLLQISNADRKISERWRSINTLAVLLGALPVLALDLAPSEMVELPAVGEAVVAFGITLGKQGGIGGASVEKSVTLDVHLPDETERRLHWREELDENESCELEEISRQFRLSSGHLRRAARLARSTAAFHSRSGVSLEDVRQAARTINRQALDTLAIYLEPLDGDWDYLAVRAETMSDLRELEVRCRLRENLREHVGKALRGQMQPGVRALFNGGSGTGKTYAARLLAAALRKDIYRLDLSTIVNKYIGETEKNLARLFSLVEELDVILLLDEGDALLTQRTAVSTANDRYANLETNYLLQRLESFEGILIVTTNAAERVDSAFQRRMETIIEFAAPEFEERRIIWQLHLPEHHALSASLLEEVAERCKLSGGQIRNIALHAATLSLDESSSLKDAHLEAAVRREYRKIGAICPLRDRFEIPLSSDRW